MNAKNIMNLKSLLVLILVGSFGLCTFFSIAMIGELSEATPVVEPSSPTARVGFEKSGFKFSEFRDNFYSVTFEGDGETIKLGDFNNAVQEFVKISKKYLGNKSNFIDKKPLNDLFFDLDKPFKDLGKNDYADRSFFGQKMLLTPGSEIAISADIHGDVDSLIRYIEKLDSEGYLDKDTLKIKKPNFYLFFLGDYVDRGPSSPEVIYLLMRLKIANPERVILLRGNHDRVGMNISSRELGDNYTGCNEKFDNLLGQKSGKMRKMFYDMLPSFVFVGVQDKDHVNYVLLTHGGFEPRFNPSPLLSHKINSTSKDKNFVFQIINPLDIASWNFSWLESINKNLVNEFRGNDPVWSYYGEIFSKNPNLGFENLDFKLVDSAIISKGKRAIEFSKKVTVDLLKAYESKEHSVELLFRGHQHAGMHKYLNEKSGNYGIYNSWTKGDKNQLDASGGLKLSKECPVWTLDAFPYMKGVGTRVFAVLQMKEGGFNSWTLKRFDAFSL